MRTWYETGNMSDRWAHRVKRLLSRWFVAIKQHGTKFRVLLSVGESDIDEVERELKTIGYGFREIREPTGNADFADSL